MKKVKYMLAVWAMLFIGVTARCQQKDSIPAFIKGEPPALQPKPEAPKDSPYKTDSATRKKHDPRKATLYSTFLPGLGQVYNKKYWKVPLVAAALGIPAYFYFDSKTQYQKSQFAISVLVMYLDSATGVPNVPDAVMAKVDTNFRPFVRTGEDNVLRAYRNEQRQNQDYSALFFLLFWGLQIVDATVDAHLKEFDVSDRLTMRLGPSNGDLTGARGLSLVFEMHPPKFKPIPLP